MDHQPNGSDKNHSRNPRKPRVSHQYRKTSTEARGRRRYFHGGSSSRGYSDHFERDRNSNVDLNEPMNDITSISSNQNQAESSSSYTHNQNIIPATRVHTVAGPSVESSHVQTGQDQAIYKHESKTYTPQQSSPHRDKINHARFQRRGQRHITILQQSSSATSQSSRNLTSNIEVIVPRRFVRDRTALPQCIESPQQNNSSTIQSQMSESQLKSNTLECMICCDNIHRLQPIWYCDSCFNIFHMKCAIEWCNKSIRSRNEAISAAQYPSLNQNDARESQRSVVFLGSSQGIQEDYQAERMSSIEWPCPACRVVLHNKPGKYKCFCAKVTRPEANKYLTPHSCGQMCGRKRPEGDCAHSCNSICHPGRCNPCSLTSKKSCYCGKKSQEVKCTDVIGSCEQKCGKLLACGRHTCENLCHPGSCENCNDIMTLICYCGNQVIQKLCTDLAKNDKIVTDGFSCDKICHKELDCGRHKCQKKCHPGPTCPSCDLLSENLKTCPCGSTQLSKSVIQDRKFCSEPIPTCDNKCNRPLICGSEKSHHKCQKKCHQGSCPPCKLKTNVRCECGASNRTVDCALMFEKVVVGNDEVHFNQINYKFKCELKCNKAKNCKRHRCQNKCCTASITDDSGIHICEQICNKRLQCGKHNCEETCHPGNCGDCANIGWEELACHCGATVKYPPIPCGSKRPTCHKQCRRPHECGHPVKHECHDDDEKCPPCTVFVKKSCFCGADSKDSVYCYLKGYSCGRTCKKLLSCGQHTCQRVCHENKCEIPNERNVILCNQPCPVPRIVCKHPCALPCHGKTPCPSVDCKKSVEINCECGNRTERLECFKITRDVVNRSRVAMLSMNRSDQDSIIIDLSKMPTHKCNTDDPFQQRKLDCDESCSLYKRNKALAEALNIEQPDLSSRIAITTGEDPLHLLKKATARDYKFVAATFNSLVKLIKSAKESEKRFIFLQFPPAERLRREVIHELSHHFKCTSEGKGEEPFRQVVVRAYKNKSTVPEFTIEELLPVDG